MRAIMILLIVALILRNALYFGNISEVFRALALLSCSIVTVLWFINNVTISMLARYWVLLVYILFLFVSVFMADDTYYVLFQVFSVSTVILFSIAYFESRRYSDQSGQNTLINTSAIILFIVSLISLLLIFISPETAFEKLYGGEIRFRGLYAKASMMGASAGLLIGISIFGIKHKIAKIIFSLVGISCLALTLSRTYWIATMFSGGCISYIYYKSYRKWSYIVGTMTVILFVSLNAFDINLNNEILKKYTRADTIQSFTGRTELWSKGLSAFQDSPILGYGFTAGSSSLNKGNKLFSKSGVEKITSRDVGRSTLHSGYIQSMLDIGVLGTIFYLLALIIPCKRYYQYDKGRIYGAEYFILLFLIISNVTENVIYTVSVYHGAIFWVVAALGLSLRKEMSGHEDTQSI